MSAYLQHSDPNVYPRPGEFIPERWLSNVTPAMNRNYVPFSKGSRNCLGMKYVSVSLSYSRLATFVKTDDAFIGQSGICRVEPYALCVVQAWGTSD